MGQGFSLATPSAGSAGIDIPELSDLVYEKSIGNARFMKSIRARHHDGVALVKVLVKPYTPMPLGKYKRDIESEPASETFAEIAEHMTDSPQNNVAAWPMCPMRWASTGSSRPKRMAT